MDGYVDESLDSEVRKYPHLYNFSVKYEKYVYMGYNSWGDIFLVISSRANHGWIILWKGFSYITVRIH